MKEIDEALAWARDHRIAAGIIAAWMVLTAIGHIPIREETARRYPRLFALIMLGRDWGNYFARGLRPLVGLVAPGAVKHLIDAVYPTTPERALRSATAAPPGEMKPPVRDPAPSVPAMTLEDLGGPQS